MTQPSCNHWHCGDKLNLGGICHVFTFPGRVRCKPLMIRDVSANDRAVGNLGLSAHRRPPPCEDEQNTAHTDKTYPEGPSNPRHKNVDVINFGGICFFVHR